MTAPFALDQLRRETFVRQVEYCDQTASTNDLALERAAQYDCPMPLLVLAGRQTAGRGRGANRWWSSEGALTFSLALEADSGKTPPARRPLIALAQGLAVCEAVAELLPHREVGVKWPNDVQIDGKKVSGVLVETARRDECVVVGVGVNVNNTLAEAPEEIAHRAISLTDAAGRRFNMTDVLLSIVRRFAHLWEALSADQSGLLVELLRRRCLLTGRNVTVDVGGQRIAGLCRGLADDGALLLETDAGPRRLYAGVVVSIE